MSVILYNLYITVYRNPDFGGQNTFHIQEHFLLLQQLAEFGINSNLTNFTSYQQLTDEIEVEINVASFNEEIDFVESRIKDYYTLNPEVPVFWYDLIKRKIFLIR